MKVNKGYPKVGLPIAPRILAPILDITPSRSIMAKIVDPNLRMADLDENSWNRFERATCLRLAHLVLSTLKKAWLKLPTDILAAKLPEGGYRPNLDELGIGTRTFNCLARLCRQRRFQEGALIRWNQMTIGELIEIRSFGARSLLDFLSAYEFATNMNHEPMQDEIEAVNEVDISVFPKPLLKWMNSRRLVIPKDLLKFRLPNIPETSRDDALDLDFQTMQSLARVGIETNAQSFSRKTLKELLAVPGIGVSRRRILLNSILRTCSARNNLVNVSVGGVDAVYVFPVALEEWIESKFKDPPLALSYRIPAPSPQATNLPLALDFRTERILREAGIPRTTNGISGLTLQ